MRGGQAVGAAVHDDARRTLETADHAPAAAETAADGWRSLVGGNTFFLRPVTRISEICDHTVFDPVHALSWAVVRCPFGAGNLWVHRVGVEVDALVHQLFAQAGAAARPW